MSEAMAWTIVGICVYMMGYLTIGVSTNYIWKNWAWNKVGQFWDYGLFKGMYMYYPKLLYFMREYNILYSFIRVMFWPVMIPCQLVLQTKVLNRMSTCKYYYY